MNYRVKTIKKLEVLGLKILKDLDKGQNPFLEIPIRSLSNVVFDGRTRSLSLGDKKAKRFFFHVGHAKKFMQTLLVASFCKELLKENIHTSLRDMFYALKRTLPNSHENTFDNQVESDPIVVDLEVTLDALREQLHLNADVRGRVVGDVIIEDRGDRIDWSRLGSGGWAIPSNVENIKFKKVNAKFILCLPKYEEIVVKIGKKVMALTVEEVFKFFQQGKIIEVVSFDENLRLKFGRVISMIKRKPEPEEKMFRIETCSGSYSFFSENHKIPVIDKDGIKLKRAKEISESDYLLEAKYINIVPEWEKASLDLIEFLKEKFPEMLHKVRVFGDPVKEIIEEIRPKVSWWYSRKGKNLYKELLDSWKKRESMPLTYYLKFEKDKKKRKEVKLYLSSAPRSSAIPAVISITEEFVSLLGYFAAEGHVSHSIPFWTFGKHEKPLINKTLKLIKSVFKIEPRIYRLKDEYSSIQIGCGNKIAGLLLGYLVGENSHSKRVPSFLFTAPTIHKLLFFIAVVEGDGSIDKDKFNVSTVSEKFARDLRLLLRFLGIPSYLSVYSNARGFKGYGKIFRVSVLFHHFWKRKLRTSHSLWNKAPIFSFLEVKSKDSRYKMLNIYTQKTSLNFTFIHPVKVRKVESLDYKDEYIEIISVEPYHTLLHASGIFSHNCVEKNAMFERLHEDKFWKKNKCILLTTQGQPARGARRLIQRLATEFNLPVYVFCDSDPYGFYIYSVIKYGSMSLAHISDRLGTPSAKFIGLTISDIDKFNLHNWTIKAKEVDLKRAKEMLKYPWFKSKEWQRELNLFLKKKVKAELEALSGRGLRFVTETYLPKKLKEKDFLD
ncbi:MAG TPA: hypothetical protein ENF38_00265 [Candidatus Aenigmarchaeota archaeon]|nr:hypothetical protein [Candidatus Aenigmarchaeota archaeon]